VNGFWYLRAGGLLGRDGGSYRNGLGGNGKHWFNLGCIFDHGNQQLPARLKGIHSGTLL
jgi:hypothetical protein